MGNPLFFVCRELAFLNFHYHPTVAAFSLGTCELGPSLPSEYPKAMLDKFNVEFTGDFRPSVPVPPRNPLYQKMEVRCTSSLSTSAVPFHSSLIFARV